MFINMFGQRKNASDFEDFEATAVFRVPQVKHLDRVLAIEVGWHKKCQKSQLTAARENCEPKLVHKIVPVCNEAWKSFLDNILVACAVLKTLSFEDATRVSFTANFEQILALAATAFAAEWRYAAVVCPQLRTDTMLRKMIMIPRTPWLW